MVKRNIIFSIVVIVSLIAGFFLRGVFIKSPAVSLKNDSFKERETTYPLINKTVTDNLDKHFIINFQPLKESLKKAQVKYPQKTYIYFLYLNNGSWIGINERDDFTAASTIKVPLAMALLKAVEEGKINLNDSYALDELDLDKNFGNLYSVGPDKEFKVEELLKIMLEQSDNTATRGIMRIFEKIGIQDPLADVYEAMGWAEGNIDFVPSIGQTINYQKINVKLLSNMFIALYNSKYVNIEHSQQILNYLDNTPFNQKIEAGVPENIPVAHKIGISTDDETFSDCGIVYAPNRHYLLCLGSNGGDEKRAAEFMREISKTAYDYVINN